MRSYNVNIDSLKILIKDHNPDIILLNETWLKKSHSVRCKGYHILREDREDGYGGIAIMIKQHISYQVTNINNNTLNPNIQLQTIFLPQVNLHILNIYCPSQHLIQKQNWINLIQPINKPLLIMGDINCNHTAWGSSLDTQNGKNIIQSLETLDLIFLNDGSPTRLSPPGQNISVVDIALISSSISHISSWETIPDTGSSDHYPTICTIGLPPPNQYTIQKKRNLRKANWPNYTKALETIHSSPHPIDYDSFYTSITNVANENIPFTKPNYNSQYHIPWWDESCTDMVRKRINSIKTYVENPSIENYIVSRNNIALTRKFLKKKENNVSGSIVTL